MTDQIESLDVGFQDGVSAGAKKATDAVTGLGDAFSATEAKAERAGQGTKKATDEVAAGAAAAGKAIDSYAGTVERADERVRRHAQTYDQLANKFDRTKREAAAVARAIAPYQRALDDLEASSAKAGEKEELRATITAKMEAAAEKARVAVARYFKDVEAGAAAANAAAGGLSAGMAAATASAGSWAGALDKVYATAGSMSDGLNRAARALRDLNTSFDAGHTSFAEWAAGAKGLEASLRGVSAAQKAINDSVGLSRQTANTATIGATRYATTGRGSSGTGSITFGDDGSVQRLDDITAAFAAADAELDAYRVSLGLTDAAQQKYVAGLAKLQATIRRAGVEEAEATRLLNAYAAAHDPAARSAGQATKAAEATASEWQAILVQEEFAARERIAQTKTNVAANWEAQLAMDEWGAREAKAKLATEWEGLLALEEFQQRERIAQTKAQVAAAWEAQIAMDQWGAREAKAKLATEWEASLAMEQFDAPVTYRKTVASFDKEAGDALKYTEALDRLRSTAAAAGVSLDQLAADEAKLAASLSPAAIAAKKEEEALQRLVGTLDRTFGATEKLTERQALLDKALTDGVGGIRLTADQHAALSAKLREQHDLATRSATSTKLAAHETLNLGYQIQDFVVQVGSGQSAVVAMLQQAPQAVGAVGGLSRAMALLTSTTALTVMGVGSLAVGFGLVLGRANTISAELREFTVLLKATGDQAGMTAEQMRSVADGMMGGGASREEANTVVKNIVNTRKLAGEQIARDIGSLSIDMGSVFGGTSDAGRMLTGWLTTGVKGLREMAAETGALSVAQYEAARAALEHGDREKALAIAVGALKDRFSGLHRESLSPAGQAMEDLSHAYNELLNAAAEHPIVVTVQIVGADLLKEVSNFIKDPANFQFPTFSRETEFPNPFGWFIGLAKARPNPTLSEGALTGRAPLLPPAPAGTPIPGRKPTQRDGLPLDEALTISDLTAANDRLLAVMQKVGAERVIETARVQAEMAATNAGKSAKAAELEGIQAARMARAQLVQAVDDSNRAAAAEVAGADLVARAYGQSTAAVREAEIHQNALAEVARGTIEPYDAIVSRLRAVDDAQRKVQAAQFDATLKQQTDDALRLADAWGRGANAAREAGLANEALAEARKRGLAPTKDAGQIQDIGRGILARDAARRSQEFAQMAAEQRRAVELANAEFGMLGQSNAERAKAVAILQTTNTLRDKGVDLTDAGTQAYIRQAGELARVNSQLQDAAQNAANLAQPITTAFEDVVVGAKKAGDAGKALAEDLKRVFFRATVTKPAETWLTGTLTKLMSGPIGAANDNAPRPANDPGSLSRIVTSVSGGLGSSPSNAMWVQQAGSAAAVALDPQALTGRAPLPVAIRDGGQVEDLLRSEARAQGVPEAVALAIGKLESGFRQHRDDGRLLTSSAGAQGVMQLMPATAKWLGVDATDTRENVRGGIKYLAMLGRQFGGDWNMVAAAYNAGPTRVQQYLTQGRALPTETVTYVERFGKSVQTANTAVEGMAARAEGAATSQAATTQNLTTAQRDAVSAALSTVKSMDSVSTAADDIDARLGMASDGVSTAAEKLTAAQKEAAQGAVTFAQSSQQAGDFMVDGTQQALGALLSVIGAASGIKGAGIPGQVVQAGGPQGIANSFSQLGSLLKTDGIFGSNSAISSVKGFLNTPIPGLSNIGYTAPQAAAVAKTSTGTLAGGEGASTGTGAQAAGGPTWGNALGAVGYGFNAFQNFRSGNVIGGIGNTAATAMMFIPGAQPFAPLVAIGSQLLGGLFGKDRGKPAAGAGVQYVDGRQTFAGAATDNNGSAEQAQQLLQSIDAATKQFIALVGGKTNGGFGIAVESKDGKFRSRDGGPSGQLGASYDTLDEAVIAGIRHNVSQGLISASEDVLKAVKNSTKTDINEFMADVSFGKNFRAQIDAMNSALDPTSNQIKAWTEASQQLGDQVKVSVTDWKDTASRLGLATETELTAAARKGITAMMGLGPAVEPLRGVSAVTKQAEIQFEAFRPALSALGYTAAEVADMAGKYTAKLKDDYLTSVGYQTRAGDLSITQLVDPGARATSTDRVKALGLDPKFAGVSALGNVLDQVDASATSGTLRFGDLRSAMEALNAALRDGVLTGDQYGTAVSGFTAAWQRNIGVLSALRDGSAAVETAINPSWRASADAQLSEAGMYGPQVLALRDVWQGVSDAAAVGTLTGDQLRAALADLNGQLTAGTISAEQQKAAVAQLTKAWQDNETAATRLQAAEDLNVRALRAEGKGGAADAQELQLRQQREFQQAVKDGQDAAYLGGLKYVQGLEAQTAALEQQNKVTQAAQDLHVRALRAENRGGDADTLELALRQQREFQQAVKDGQDAAYLGGLKYVQGLEAEAAKKEKLAALTAYTADINSRTYGVIGRDRDSGLLALQQQQKVELSQAEDKGYDTTQLKQLQAAEYAARAFSLAQADVLGWYDQEITARQTFISTLQDGALKVAQAAKQFAAARDALAISQDAPISPQERLTETKRQWDAALEIIRSTKKSDEEKDTARTNLISLGQTLTTIEKENSAGTARALYDMVMAAEKELGTVTPSSTAATAEADLKVAQDQLKELQRARTEAAALGQKNYGKLEDITGIMAQSYVVMQGFRAPLEQLTGTKSSATLPQMLAGLTTGTLPGIMTWARAQGPDATYQVLRAADEKLGWANNPYRYTASPDIASLGDKVSTDAWMSILRSVGYTGEANAWAINSWLAAYGKADQYEGAMRAWAHERGIPGFATGTLATPPGAVWVGEQGPELLWQGGGAAVASSADSIRIAGIYQTAANDRYPAGIASYQPAAPVPPVRGGDGNAAILAELRRLNAQIVEIKQALHDEEGAAQDQRGVLLTRLIRTVEALKSEIADQKPRRAA
ncbi:transglycosylase SLT domain-containing protein [Azospirillum sp. B510]|uniref:transglycosylase SLT domain-containing protein n=1 Tax=Azospirillum sp. (strain B510) TaxID=137722 RepID=UPI00031C6207|nr:phage tail length tape measure family protein [Azospirillum sp. B510]